MDLGSALNSIMEYDIKKHCHINTNEDGDRFVGIKADSDNAMVYFPIGYELPETDAEIRTDIKHLIQVLSEFTTKDDRLLAVNKFAAPQTVDFPINAYKSVIEYYFSIGGTYYVEKEQVYITAPTGKQDWARTARKQMPLVQSRNGVSSLFLHSSRFAHQHRMTQRKLLRLIDSVFMRHSRDLDGCTFRICRKNQDHTRM